MNAWSLPPYANDYTRPLKIAGCAFSGRAARNLKENTGIESMTIHRLTRNIDGRNGLYAAVEQWRGLEVLVIDECSMIPLWLLERVLEFASLANVRHVILVGDVEQLPPIGEGQPFGDSIASKSIFVTTLTHVYRHAEGGGIATLCDDVRHGRDIQTDYGSEVSLHSEADAESTANTALAIYAELLAKGAKPADIGLLAPFRTQPFHGVQPLNQSIRQLLDHNDAVCVGDLVMATKNDYDIDVMNGMRGEVAVVYRDKSFDVRFEDRGLVDFSSDARRSRAPDGPAIGLRWAFASTIHKAQGGQFPHVIAIVPTSGAYLFGKPALYTAFSRAQKTLAVVGDISRISDIARRGGRERTTALAMLLGAPPPKSNERLGAIDMENPGFEPSEVEE